MDRTVGSPEVLREVENILSSRQFKGTTLLSELLRFLTEEALLDPSGYVTQSAIARAVMGQGADFDPGLNPAVRIAVSRLRKRLADYYGTTGRQSSLRLSVPRGGYSMSFADARGNLELDPDPQEGGALRSDRPRLLVTELQHSGSSLKAAMLASGLTEELIEAFSRFREMAVVAVHSAVRLNTESDLAAIGGTPGSRFRLTASVQMASRRLRVNVRLEADSGDTIWARNFDRRYELSNLFDIQDEIVRATVAAIGDHQGVIHRHMARASAIKPAGSVGWYNAVLAYHHYFAHVTPGAYVHAVASLERTLRRNPHEPSTSAMLADLYATDHYLGIGMITRPVERALELSRQSVRLDPTSQLGRFTLAFVHFLRGEESQFDSESRAAYKLNPNNVTLAGSLGMLTALMGRWEEGLSIMRDAVELNPLFPSWYHIVPFMDHYRKGAYAEALISAERFGMEDLFWAPLMRAAALGQLGDTRRGESALQQLFELRPDFGDAGRSLMGRMVHVPEVVEHLAEGLGKAGWREPARLS